MQIKVAYDMTPAIGTRTGIGHVVSRLYSELDKNENISLSPYTLSFKSKQYAADLPENNTFIPVPARALLLAWKYSNIFSLDSVLGNKVDLWHATNYIAPPTSTPLLITIHDCTMIKYPELVSNQVRDLVPLLKRRIVNGAHIHVPTHAIYYDVLQYFPSIDKSKVHVGGFCTPDLINGTPSDSINELVHGDPYIISIGALEPRKNHARLIEAFGDVCSSNPHVRLILVGPDGPARPDIDSALANVGHNVRSRIIITGKVSDIDRTYLLSNSLLVAYPSLYEGFGLPILEAMELNKPVVTTKEGSLKEIAGDSAVFVDAYDPKDIAKGLINIIDDEDLRNKLIAAGTKRLKEFSWEKSTSKIANIYKEVIKAYSSQESKE